MNSSPWLINHSKDSMRIVKQNKLLCAFIKRLVVRTDKLRLYLSNKLNLPNKKIKKKSPSDPLN
jgi:hypothetical protein